MTTPKPRPARWVPGFVAVCILLLVLGVVAALYSWPTVTRQVSGTVVSYRRSDSEGRGTPLLIVHLASGSTVRVPIGENIPVRYGNVVTLTEIETALFGFRRYRFTKYNEGAEQKRGADAQKDARGSR